MNPKPPFAFFFVNRQLITLMKKAQEDHSLFSTEPRSPSVQKDRVNLDIENHYTVSLFLNRIILGEKRRTEAMSIEV